MLSEKCGNAWTEPSASPRRQRQRRPSAHARLAQRLKAPHVADVRQAAQQLVEVLAVQRQQHAVGQRAHARRARVLPQRAARAAASGADAHSASRRRPLCVVPINGTQCQRAAGNKRPKTGSVRAQHDTHVAMLPSSMGCHCQDMHGRRQPTPTPPPACVQARCIEHSVGHAARLAQQRELAEA